jgi:hypothetical protein
MEISNIEKPKLKRGRPFQEIHKDFDRKEYNKNYYENNKEKYTGEYHCLICNIYCSISNKTRHNNSKTHNKILLIKEGYENLLNTY